MPPSLAVADVPNAFVSDDPTVVERHFDEFYGTRLRVDMSLRAGKRPRVSYRRTEGTSVALETVAVEGDLDIQGDSPSKFIAICVTAGRVETHIQGAVAIAGPGEVVVGATGTTSFRVRICDAELNTVVLDRSLIEQVAADALLPDGAERPSPYLGSLVPHSANAARLWIRTRAYVAETMDAGDTATPLVAASCGRLLAQTALTVFGTNATRSVVVRRTDGDAPSAYPVMLRKAMSYMEAHARYDVGVSDVAAAVYVTPRALQYMFRKHLDVTPMAYLRRIRLEHVHAELVCNNRRTTTVSTTAARWGFAHTGRFAVLYRETYGRSPHVTLRE